MMDKKTVSVGGEERESKVPESLVKRNEERLGKVAKRREDNPKQSETFLQTFRVKEAEITQLLSTADSLEDNKCELGELFKHVTYGIQTLNKFVFASSTFLRAFDLRTCKEALQALEDSARETEERLLPKKKFGFKDRSARGYLYGKNRDKREKIVSQDETDAIIESVGKEDIFDRKGEELMVEGEGRDVVVTRLEDCRLVIRGHANTIVLASIKKCVVAAGPVATSVMVQGCSGSRLAFACQQVRIHDTTDSDFYLHITTKPIIEDSVRVKFAPYPYSGMEEDMKSVGLNPSMNNWNTVDDFNWLASKPSPNWSILSLDQQITDWPALP